MDFEEINQILAMMREHELSEFELEREGLKIRIKKEAGHLTVAPPQMVAVAPAAVAASPAITAPATPPRGVVIAAFSMYALATGSKAMVEGTKPVMAPARPAAM